MLSGGTDLLESKNVSWFFLHCVPQIELALHVHPALRGSISCLGNPKSHSRTETRLLVHKLGECLSRDAQCTRRLSNCHPGEVLLEEFLNPMAISQNRLARDIAVPPRRINEIVQGKRAVTADTALRFARYFGTSESFWMGLQADYDLEEARQRLGERLKREVRTRAA